MYFDSVSGVRGADSFQSDSIFTLLFMTLITTSLEMFVSCISEAPLFPPSSVLHLSCCDGLLIGEKRVLYGSLSFSLSAAVATLEDVPSRFYFSFCVVLSFFFFFFAKVLLLLFLFLSSPSLRVPC